MPIPSPVTGNTTGSTAALSQSASSATSRLMAGMSPAGNIPSGASDQEKVCYNKVFLLTKWLQYFSNFIWKLILSKNRIYSTQNILV